MSQPRKQRDPSLEGVITELRRDDVSDPAVERAADRVWARLLEHFPAPVTATASDVEKIRGCSDFQTLLPSYLGGSLSEARASFPEDHIH